MVVVVTIIITPIFLSAMWKFTKGCDLSSSVVEEYLRIWGIYCQKPLPGKDYLLLLKKHPDVYFEYLLIFCSIGSMFTHVIK